MLSGLHSIKRYFLAGNKNANETRTKTKQQNIIKQNLSILPLRNRSFIHLYIKKLTASKRKKQTVIYIYIYEYLKVVNMYLLLHKQNIFFFNCKIFRIGVNN